GWLVPGRRDHERAAETRRGWVRGRVQPGEARATAAAAPVELERGDARLLLRVARYEQGEEETAPAPTAEPAGEPAQLPLFETSEEGVLLAAPELPVLEPVAAPPLYEVRSLSYSAISLFERCSYRFFAERVAGMRERRPIGTGPSEGGLLATD